MDDGIETTRTAVADGVRVRKTIETGPDDRATVTLDVDVERDQPATVRLTEPALASIPRDEIELHTDHGAEFWRVGDDATFEREFDAGETFQVVYRVAALDPDRFETLDGDPIVDAIEAGAVDGDPAEDRQGAADIDDVVDRGGSDAVRELIEGGRESLLAAPTGPDGVALSLESGSEDADASAERQGETPTATDGTAGDDSSVAAPGAESPSGDGSAEDAAAEEAAPEGPAAAGPSPEENSVEVPSVANVSTPEADAETSSGGDGDADEEPDAAPDAVPNAESTDRSAADLQDSMAATPSGGVARVLLEELRSGDVDEEVRAALRSELEPGRSQDLRIKHLQSQVGEFAAYVEMLEAFVDEHGTFEAVVGGMDATVDSLDDEVDSIRSELDELETSVEADVDAVSADVDAVSADVDDLQVEQSDLEEGQEALEENQEALEEGQTDLEAQVERLEAELETVDERLAEFEAFEERLSGVFQDVGDPSS